MLTSIKHYLLDGFPLLLDAPSQVSLFAYDNNTLVVESYRSEMSRATVTALGNFTKLRNLATGEVVQGKVVPNQNAKAAQQTEFTFDVAPHSFVALVEE